MADLSWFVIPTDAELEDVLDSDHSPKARRRVIESAIRYMRRGKPVPTIYLRLLESILKRDRGVAGAPRRASRVRVGEMIDSLISVGISETKAFKIAASRFKIGPSTARTCHHEYLEAKRG